MSFLYTYIPCMYIIYLFYFRYLGLCWVFAAARKAFSSCSLRLSLQWLLLVQSLFRGLQ